MKNKIIYLFSFIPLICFAITPLCQAPKVPVTGFAQSFLSDARIDQAKITVLETGKVYYTNQAGRFQFCAQPGSAMTLELQKTSFLPWKNFKATQSATFTVPKNGFVGKSHEITFQVPTMATYKIFKVIIAEERRIKVNPNQCVAVTTVTAYHKTLADNPQGDVGATILLSQNNKKYTPKNKPFYFGDIAGKTNPFTPDLTATSLDGGVLIYNLAVSTSLYQLSAAKLGTHFSSARFQCRPGAFINISPPQGPSAQRLST